MLTRRSQIRIPLVAAIVTFLFLATLAIVARTIIRRVTFGDLDEELETLSIAIGSDLELQGVRALEVESNLLAFRLEHHSGVLVDRGRVVATSGYLAHATDAEADALAQRVEASFTAPEPFSGQRRLCRIRVTHLSGNSRGATLILFRSIEPTLRTLRRIDWALLAIVFVGVAGAATITAIAVRRALHPVEVVTAVAEAAEAADLSRRVPGGRGGEEVERLSHVINSLFDRLERAFESQRRLIADAAHELKTPVAAIAAEAQEALRADTPDDQRRRLLLSIEKSARAMASETNDLLTLARGEAVPRVQTDVDLAQLAEGLGAPATRRGDVRVRGDRAALERLLANLVKNARAYGGEAEIDLAGDSDRVTLVVRDRGPGIAPADRERIFERFTRLPHARAANPQGSGLGLAIVAQAVRNHGGSIEVRDREGGGAEFVVTIPR